MSIIDSIFEYAVVFWNIFKHSNLFMKLNSKMPKEQYCMWPQSVAVQHLFVCEIPDYSTKMVALDVLSSLLTYQTLLVGISTGLLTYYIYTRSRYKLPPGPWALPLIGNWKSKLNVEVKYLPFFSTTSFLQISELIINSLITDRVSTNSELIINSLITDRVSTNSL